MRHPKLVIAGVIFLILFGIAFKYLRAGIPFLYDLTVKKNQIQLKQEGESSLNILLLGIGGANHDGPDLSDTIILANVNPEKKTVNMYSIPRDLWVPQLQDKINDAYASGQEKGGKGLVLAKAVVEKVTGQSIDYVFVIDFSGFVKAVDSVGGIDVQVSHTLDDYAYPVAGKENELCGHEEEAIASFSAQIATGSATDLDIFPCRFKHIHVDKGLQHMDGAQALEFVRSRHGLGSEGSDFARSRRQQEVIAALRKKVLSLGILLNPVKVIGLVNILQENIHTDIAQKEYDDFVKLANKMKDAKVKSHVLGEQDAFNYGLFVNPPISEEYRFKWVLIPRAGNGNFSEIKQFINCIEKYSECEVTENSVRKVASQSATLTPKAQ